jgi:hypothetical protein
MLRLVAEVESRRTVARDGPWRRYRLGVRVEKSGTPGVDLPKEIRKTKVVVFRESTAETAFPKGSRLNLSAGETAPLLPDPECPPVPARPGAVEAHADRDGYPETILAGPSLRAVVDVRHGALVQELALPGGSVRTVRPQPLRLGVSEGRPVRRGGASWSVSGRKNLWKARFRRGRAPAGTLLLIQKAGKDKAHARRVLALGPDLPMLEDRLEIRPKPKKDGKGGRPDKVLPILDVALCVGRDAHVELPEADRRVVWQHVEDSARAFLFWAGTTEMRLRPEGGFAAAMGDEGVHVLLFSPRHVEWIGLESRRDGPAVFLRFARTRPPVLCSAAHVVADRIAFAENRGFAAVAVTGEPGERVARVVATVKGARAAEARATVEVAGEARPLVLPRRPIEEVGAVWGGALPLGGEEPGEVVVRIGKETIVVPGPA